MKKLPSIYKNEINKKIKNNREVTYIKEEKQNINEIIDSIFNGVGYSYNIPLIITTKDKIYETSLISRNNKNINTLDNQSIPISEIITIERKSSK